MSYLLQAQIIVYKINEYSYLENIIINKKFDKKKICLFENNFKQYDYLFSKEEAMIIYMNRITLDFVFFFTR